MLSNQKALVVANYFEGLVSGFLLCGDRQNHFALWSKDSQSGNYSELPTELRLGRPAAGEDRQRRSGRPLAHMLASKHVSGGSTVATMSGVAGGRWDQARDLWKLRLDGQRAGIRTSR